MVPRTPTVSAVVLLVPQHLSFFCGPLVANLAKMTAPFDELLVIASGLSAIGFRRAEKSLSSLSTLRNKRIVRVPLGSVGANRNHGMRHATSHFVTFLDSDDLYSPDYCIFLKMAYQTEPYEVLLHSYIPIASQEAGEPGLDLLGALRNVGVYTNQDFCVQPLSKWKVAPRLLKSTSLELQEEADVPPIHHGHMTVARGLPLRFHEDPFARNEDGVFLQQCLSSGHRIHFYPAKLSAYRLHSSANPFRYRIARKIDSVVARLFRQSRAE